MTFKVVCIKTCISPDKFNIAYEGEFYEAYKETEINFKKRSIFQQWLPDPIQKKQFAYPTYELCDVDASEFSLGNFDKRNFLTLAEYRDYQIEQILN